MQSAAVFLLPNGTFFVELAVFLIIIFVIGRYILPPLNRAMSQRQEQIRTSLESAEQARLDAAQADDERRAALEEARQQAREIVSQGNRTAEQILADVHERAQREYDRIVASADADITLARRRAIEEAAARVGELVLEVVERIVGREIDTEAHRDLIDEAIGALNSEQGAGGAAAGAGSRQ